MSSDELEQVLDALTRRRAEFYDTVFVLTLERTDDGKFKLLEYGMKDIGDLAAWLAVQQEHTKGEQA
ncbi:MAG: hypothetical protein AB1509_14165 [Chloroflexota bacterium]